MNIGISHLRAFVAVLDCGSFSLAAAELGISQSAVSHSVATLERSLGAPVFVRSSGVRLTVLGEQILVHARQVVGAYGAIRDVASRHGGQPSGPVRIAATPTACQGILPQLLHRWQHEFPLVQVVVLEGDDAEVESWLDEGAVELAVLIDRPSDAGVRLTTDHFHALLGSDHPLADEAEIDIADLDDDPMIVSTSGCEEHVRKVYQLAHRPLRPGHRVRDMGTLLAMVRSGLGVSVVPGLTSAMLDHRLVMIPLRQYVSRDLTLTGPIGRPWHKAAQVLVESCRQVPSQSLPGQQGARLTLTTSRGTVRRTRTARYEAG
ncbi:LysR family transcriptional regulator [Streptomyces griseorubiginosus]|uniref:LysR family transcriptional regulator n=1 Tax=Streptomyces griseorubiginosus TaxID=67304 RepID=UPI0033DB91F8